MGNMSEIYTFCSLKAIANATIYFRRSQAIINKFPDKYTSDGLFFG